MSEQLTMMDKFKMMKMVEDKRDNQMPEEFKCSSANYGNYKRHLNDVVLELNKLMNFHYQPAPDFKKEPYAEKGDSGADQLDRGLQMLKDHAWETNFIQRESEFCERAKEVEKQFQKEGHARIKKMRKFLGVDYPRFLLLEAEVAKLSSLATKGGEKAAKANALYQAKLLQMSDILTVRSEAQKVDHLQELVQFMDVYADFHDRMAQEHERMINQLPKKQPAPRKKNEEKQ